MTSLFGIYKRPFGLCRSGKGSKGQRVVQHIVIHRIVAKLAGNLSLLHWKDIVARVTEVTAGDDEEIALIKKELLNRILAGSKPITAAT
jgi:hypothetical protein